MGVYYDSGFYDDADFIVFSRPIEVGSELIYYSREKCLNIQGRVKASTLAFIWIVDKEESENREHFIAYSDIVQIIKKGVE